MVLSVSDTGTGIDGAHLDKIFDPFFTTKELKRGTGMGLATVYGIVKQNRGEILVENQRQGGAVFHVYWPSTQEWSFSEPQDTGVLECEPEEEARSEHGGC